MIPAIEANIATLRDSIVDAKAEIKSAQSILNEIANRQLVITQQREIDATAAAKESALIYARSEYQWLDSLVEDYEQRLASFDEDASAQEPTGPQLQPCEPQFLYELDPTSLIPQVSEEGLDIINAYITGEITLERI